MNTSNNLDNKFNTSSMPRIAEHVDEGEIDFEQLFSTVGEKKWFILFFSLGLSIITAVFSFQIPNQYQAQVLMIPVNSVSSGGLAALASKYGGLASMAGIDLPASEDDLTMQALSVLRSRKFINEFIKHSNLKPALFPARWDQESLSWKSDESNVLGRLRGYVGLSDERPLTYEGQESLKPGEPSMWEAYELFSEDIMRISEDKNTGAVTLFIQWYSPIDVRDWANQLVDDLNDRLRNETIAKSERTIEYLKEQIKQTSLLELREILFGLVEEHVKNITLAKTNPEYVFKVIDPAVVPEEKSKPKRGLIIVLGFVLGVIMAVFIVLVQNMWRREPQTVEDIGS